MPGLFFSVKYFLIAYYICDKKKFRQKTIWSSAIFYVSKGGFMGEIILAIIKAVITAAEKDKKN